MIEWLIDGLIWLLDWLIWYSDWLIDQSVDELIWLIWVIDLIDWLNLTTELTNLLMDWIEKWSFFSHVTWWHALFSSEFILVLLWSAPSVWPALRTMLPMVMPTHQLFPTTWSNWLSGKRYYYIMHYTLCYKLLKVFFIFDWTYFLFPSMYRICSCYT